MVMMMVVSVVVVLVWVYLVDFRKNIWFEEWLKSFFIVIIVQ